MKNTFGKIKSFWFEHKIWSVIIILAIIVGGYEIVKAKSSSSTVTKYVIGEVKKGTIVSSVSGSGQVSASNEVTIKSQTSGDIVALNAKVGQEIKTGDLIAQVDAESAAIDLKNAQIALAKLTQSNTSSITQNQNSIAQAYDTGFNDVVSTNLDFPDVISGMNDLFYTQSGYLSDQNIQNLSETARKMRNSAGVNFDSAKTKQASNSSLYQKTTRTSPTDSVDSLISDTYDTVKKLTEALKDARNAVDYIKNQQPTDSKNATIATTAETNLDSWINKMNSHLSDLLSIKNNIAETKNSLSDLGNGSSSLDIQAQKLSLEQKQLAYDNSFIRAPFDGVLAQLSVHKGDTISSGATIGTFITKQKVADITLNEVDVAKIKTGDKATLTFDAVDGLSITGQVSSIDLVGTVSQGVVSYAVQIGFDTQDDRVKSGMSVSAAIITDTQQDVLTVPISAIKTQGSTSYVDTVGKSINITDSQGITLATTPTQQQVTTGASDDTLTQIISGLNEGDKIITKTITGTATKTTTTSAPSLFGGGARTGSSVIRTSTGR